MNVTGNEITDRKRHLQEIPPQVPAAIISIKPASLPGEKTPAKTTAIQPSQTLTPAETRQILKRFEPLAPVLEKALDSTRNIHQEIQNLEALTRFSLLMPEKPLANRLPRPQVAGETVRPKVGTLINTLPPTPTALAVLNGKTSNIIRENLRVQPGTTHRTEGSKGPITIEAVNVVGIGNNPPKTQAPVEVIAPRLPQKPQTFPEARPVQEMPRLVTRPEQPDLSSRETGNKRTLPMPAAVPLVDGVGLRREVSQAPPPILQPSIPSISGTVASATLIKGSQAAEPTVIPAAGNELSPAVVRERVFANFQRRIRQQEPRVLIAEARKALQSQQPHPPNTVLPLEQTAPELRNNRILGHEDTRAETVARIPIHRDNRLQIVRTDPETTAPTTENVNRPRLTPSRGINPAPPLSNINQLRRPLPTNTRSRLVGVKAVNILDLVL